MTAPERSSLTEPLILGVVETPVPALTVAGRRQLITAGWVWSRSGPVDLQISCSGQELRSVQYGLTRSDVGAAWPSIPSAARCGFLGVVDVNSLAAGTHTIVLRAKASGGVSREWRREFVVGDRQAAYQAWLARCALRPPDESGAGSTSWSLTVIVDARAPGGRADVWRTLASIHRLRPRPLEVILFGSTATADGAAAGPNEKISESSGMLPQRRLRGTLRDALMISLGDWITVLTAGDLLHALAIQAVRAQAARHPECGLWYADHDHLGHTGVRHRPVLKPAWSPVWLRRHNYIAHPWFGEGPSVRDIAAACGEATSLQEHEVLLRLGNGPDRSVGHIPSILLSRPDEQPTPTAAIEPGPPQSGNVPRVSVVIPSRLSAPGILARCLDSLTQRADSPGLEILIVFNGLAAPDDGAVWASRWPSVTALYCDGAFNWSQVNNLAAERAQGEMLLFLNDDIECIGSDWLDAMLQLARRPEVGAVGAVLRYPDGRIQHAGVHVAARPAIDCRHTLRFCRFDDPELQWLLGADRDQSAVTGACLLTRRDVFTKAGGFDERLALVLNDVDYCLRLGRMGLRSVVAAAAVLIHHEGLSRAGMPESEDVRFFEQRWQGAMAGADPFYHPHLRRDTDDWTLDTDALAGAGADPRILSTRTEPGVIESASLRVEHRLRTVRRHFEADFAPTRVVDAGPGVPNDEGSFDLILSSWIHPALDAACARQQAIRLFEKLAPGGVAAITLASTRREALPEQGGTLGSGERPTLRALPLVKLMAVHAGDAGAAQPGTLVELAQELQLALQGLGVVKTHCEIDNAALEPGVVLYFRRAWR